MENALKKLAVRVDKAVVQPHYDGTFSFGLSDFYTETGIENDDIFHLGLLEKLNEQFDLVSISFDGDTARMVFIA